MTTTLPGCVPCPAERAKEWRRKGWWEGRTVDDVLRAAARAQPHKTALIDGERALSYAALEAAVDAAAAALQSRGLQPLDRVVMQLPNSVEFVIAYFALSRIGVIPVMALRAHRYSEVRHFIEAAGAVAYLVPASAHGFDYRALGQELQRDCPTLTQVLVLGDPLPGQVDLRALLQPAPEQAGAQAHPLSQRPSAAPPAVVVDPDAVAVMLLSGGTTSLSKLIPRTHNDYVLNARLCAQAAGFDAATVFLALLPLGHNYNLASPGLLGAFYAGGTVVIGQGLEAEQVFPLIARHGVTVVASAVPLITQWLNSPVPAAHDLRSLRVVQNGGARLPPELRRRVRAQWGATPQEVYGTAEGLINMTRLDDPDDVLMDSSGSPVCVDDEILVVDDAGNEVPDGEPGELITRGPYTIAGYYNAPDKNLEAFTADGHYRMGDVVRKRGRNVYAEGRKKDLINRGGEKISCEEIENLILKHPAVNLVALVAMPDPVFGERACAFVETRPGHTLGFDELVAFLKAQRIASFKLPERLEVIERLPTSLVGKILKRQLRERVTEQLQAEAAAAAEATARPAR